MYSNPPFDQRINSYSWGGTGLQRGKIVSDTAGLESRVQLNFLYNPSVVSASHSVDLSAEGVLPQYYRSSDDIGQNIVPLNSSVSFDLLFDRSYELWDSAKSRQEDYKNGVWADIRTFYKMVGMLDPSVSVTTSDDGTTSAPTPITSTTLGPMIPTNAVVIFGGDNSLTYYGMVQSGNVQFTHWTGTMVPSRATLSIGMQLIPRTTDPRNLLPSGPLLNYTPPRVR